MPMSRYAEINVSVDQLYEACQHRPEMVMIARTREDLLSVNKCRIATSEKNDDKRN